MRRTWILPLLVVAVLGLSGAPGHAPGASASPEAVRLALEQTLAADLRQRLHAGQAERIAAAVLRFSDKYDLDPDLVMAVLEVESSARVTARSPKGAMGLMQVMPHMAARLDLAGNLTTVESNIEAGCMILAHNIRRLGEDDGVSAYFWGSDIRGVSYLHRVQRAREHYRRLLAS